MSDPERHFHSIAMTGTKVYRESYLGMSLDEAAARAHVLLQQMKQRELDRKLDGISNSQNDPEYPRREAQELVSWVLSQSYLPGEIFRLVDYLLFRPKPVRPLGPPGTRRKADFWEWEHKSSDLHFKGWKEDRYYTAARYLAKNPNASGREVAKKAGVDHKTITKWKREEHFIDYQECYLRARQGYYDVARYVADIPRALNHQVAKKFGVDCETIAKWKTEKHFIDFQEHYLRGLGAFFEAARYLADNPHASDHQVAKKVSVDNKTIAKWKTEEDFVDELKWYLSELSGE